MTSAANRKIRSVSYAKYGYLFILPFFLVYCFFQLWPLINTFILTMYGNGKSMDTFVGLDNFQALLFGTGDNARQAAGAHKDFINCLGNTFILWFGNFIPQIAISLALAVWFTDAKLKIPGKGFFKIIMYMPNIITAASVAALFLKLFDKTYGPVNALFGTSINFVEDEWISRIMIMFIQAWMWFGNTMIMLMSGIMGLNPSLFEAANIDGASSGQVFRKITLPLLRPILLYTVITSMIGGLQMFDIPLMFNYPTKTNPHTKTVAVYIYKSIYEKMHNNYGFSSTASIILFVITVALGSVTFYINRDKEAIARKKERKANMKKLKAQQSGLGGMEI